MSAAKGNRSNGSRRVSSNAKSVVATKGGLRSPSDGDGARLDRARSVSAKSYISRESVGVGRQRRANLVDGSHCLTRPRYSPQFLGTVALTDRGQIETIVTMISTCTIPRRSPKRFDRKEFPSENRTFSTSWKAPRPRTKIGPLRTVATWNGVRSRADRSRWLSPL